MTDPRFKTFLFPHPGPLTAGKYLLGTPRWARGVQLHEARVNCVAGASLSPTVLELEAGGILTGLRLSILPAAPHESVDRIFPVLYTAGPNVDLRWKVISAPGDATHFALTLITSPLGDVLAPAQALTVIWVNGSERFTIFNYDPATHLFSEASAGIATGRAAISNSGNFLCQIQGIDAMKITSGQVLQLNSLYCIGGSGVTDFPRLEFQVGARRCATLTRSGRLAVVDYSETPVVTGGSDRFNLYGNGTLSAVLGGPGINLAGLQLNEPIN